MNSVFKVTILEGTVLQNYKDKAMKELNEFFEMEWVNNTPKIFVVDDRKTINLLREQETNDTLACWSFGDLAIFILNPQNISQESSHDGSKYDIEKYIKHELCHSFFYRIFGKSKFEWINEGIAIYTAEQLDKYPMPEEFKNFLENKKVYAESGSVIKLLLDNFGKAKLFDLFRKQKGIEDEKALGEVFKSVYGGDLSYRFINGLKEKGI